MYLQFMIEFQIKQSVRPNHTIPYHIERNNKKTKKKTKRSKIDNKTYFLMHLFPFVKVVVVAWNGLWNGWHFFFFLQIWFSKNMYCIVVCCAMSGCFLFKYVFNVIFIYYFSVNLKNKYRFFYFSSFFFLSRLNKE